MATPRLTMPYIESSQAQKEIVHNQALNMLDLVVQASVRDRGRSEAPTSPAAGDCYLVGAGAGGDWVGHDDTIAAWYGTAWRFQIPIEGMILHVEDEALLLVRGAGSWRTMAEAAALAIDDVAGLSVALEAKLAASAVALFATALQGARADTALQPADIGTGVQAHAARLDALAALSWSSDRAPFFTGGAGLDSYALSSFVRGLSAKTSALTFRQAIAARDRYDPVSARVLKHIHASHTRLATRARDSLSAASTADDIVTSIVVFPGGVAFFGGVLLPDGRVFCVPYNSTTARIYDPATDTLTTPSGTYPGSSAFAGGILLPDGRVFCVPANSTTARIYDPVTDTSTTPGGTYPGSSAFAGGVLLPDGRVFCVPRYSTTARIYDPVTDTSTTPSGTYPGVNAFTGGILLPDGRVFCVPRNSTTARIYNPVTDTLTTPGGTYPGADSFVGGVLLPDGRVFCVPASSSTARIYDPATDTLTTPSGTYPGGGAYASGVLLPDGRVFCVPASSITGRIYDPLTNTLTTPSGIYPGSSAFVGGILLPDGRVFCVPANSTVAILAVGAHSHRELNFPTPLLLGGTLNKF